MDPPPQSGPREKRGGRFVRGPGPRGAAAADRLRNELLGAALDTWEAEDGPFTDAELDAAADVLDRTGSRRATS